MFLVPGNRCNGCQLNPRRYGEVPPRPTLHACNSTICSRPKDIFSIDMQPQGFCALEVQIAVLAINSKNSHRCRSPNATVWPRGECIDIVTHQSFATRQCGDLLVAQTVQAILRSNPDVMFAVSDKTPYACRRQPVEL